MDQRSVIIDRSGTIIVKPDSEDGIVFADIHWREELCSLDPRVRVKR